MNRTGTVPPSLRSMPNGNFGVANQPAQPALRAGTNRLSNGKPAVTNGAGWAFGGNSAMLGGAMQSSSRPLGGNLSFAQSLSGSTPATPLDLSEFPSLSNNAQNSSASAQSMWGGPARGVGAPGQRPPVSSMSQSNQPEDPFASVLRAGGRETFRFGSQPGTNPSQQAPSGNFDEFPPLSGNTNGEIGSGRGSLGMNGLGGFAAQGVIGSSMSQPNRTANGLLNVVSANARTAETRAPIGSRPPDRGSVASGGEEPRQRSSLQSESMAAQSSMPDGLPGSYNTNSLGAIGNTGLEGVTEPTPHDDEDSTSQDPLAGMAPNDKWGLKGLMFMMNNFPDYNALMVGIDPAKVGFDLGSKEKISSMTYSPVGDEPPRKALLDFKVPECYKVNNVQPLEQKIGNFNEETLLWIFYTSPMDRRQILAAKELHHRGWRWHLKLRMWLTKDNEVQPIQMTPTTERGYYVVWDLPNWRRERRELVLQYSDLETTAGAQL